MASIIKWTGTLGGTLPDLLHLGKPKPPPPPPTMPDPGNPAINIARQQAAASAQSRSGRASTILSSPALSDYSSPTLG